MNRSHRMGVDRGARRRLERALTEARQLSCSDDVCENLTLLASEARRIEAAFPHERLRPPSPRLHEIMRNLIMHGENDLTQEALMDALRGERLTLRALWSVPAALRICVIEALAPVCSAIVRDARDCAAADRWVQHPHRLSAPLSPAFIEHALMRCNEENLTRARALLDNRLQKRGLTAGQVIRQAHDARAHQRLRLINLTHALRFIDALDWQACFEALSEVDAELRRDPAGVYPLMDDASRQLIREQVEAVARATGLSEIAVARHAVSAARQSKGLSLVEKPSLEKLENIDPEATCCWWLNDDRGRRALLRHMGRPRAHLPRRVPDSHGLICLLMPALTGGFTMLLWRWLRNPWLLPACVPLAWAASDALAGRVFPWFIKPAHLLKLDIDRLPDAWRTLIVTPVLLSDVKHVNAACDNLEALGCLETDPNLACVLLGDFADADHEHMPGDDAIVARARERVAGMNRRAGREKYYYLHRPRTLLKPDGRWMGRDRKRGALMDLNRVLLGGSSSFTVEDAACDALRGRYAYVVTLDADTRMLPGTAHRLVGALAHPLNRRYAVLQPRMEVAPSAVANRFSMLCAGVGGLDTYPTRASSLWMDVTGVGVFGGKGVYRVADFQRAVEGRLPEGRVLSHDLIEGALAGAGFLGDIALFDGCPATLSGWMKRRHRWTRGDWQLLPLMLSPKCPVSPADRFRMLDNLMRSLAAPATWMMLMSAVWTGRAEPLAVGLLIPFQDALLRPFETDNWRRGLARLATLPLTAFSDLDAALRALWRVCASGQHLMDWVPSADAERDATRDMTGKFAALLTLPGLLIPGSLPMVGGLFALFWAGSDWVRGMERQPIDRAKPLAEGQRAMLLDLARDTWRFFSENVPLTGPALPPDNVQLDPPNGAARRTSPTNAGLYLMSCAAAKALGIIDQGECAKRVTRALDALEAAEKWHGHLYNWIDIDTLAQLPPRYVSSVDSGNLAACALACANLIGDAKLAERLRSLAEGMDFTALYDARRQLFRIGVDVDHGTPSQSHYDLLASESRILSFTALMLGQIPLKHWSHLGRKCVPAGDGAALASWSGTMFEYLMPELLMKAPAASLLGESVRNAVKEQMKRGAPWGVSESGYHAFDHHMNYQYRAFGLESLALSGSASGGVVAPYASALALAVAPRAAADNLETMTRLGWRGPQGFYEAADLRQPTPALVRSHMAHHQGMALCAICNALTGDSLAEGFMADPRARALELLLEERPACRTRLKPLPKDAAPKPTPAGAHRNARDVLDVHLLRGRDATAFVTADGAFHYARKGYDADRFYGDLTDRPDAAKLHLHLDGRPVDPTFTCRYSAGSARYDARVDGLAIAMTLTLSPEDDTLFRSVDITNKGPRKRRVEALDALPVALAKPADFTAHPAFQLLFVESEGFGEHGLLFRRRPRNPGEICPALIHEAIAGEQVQRESRYERVFDRSGKVSFDLDGGMGAVLNPASALKISFDLEPGAVVHLCFALRLVDDDACVMTDQAQRAAALNAARTEALLGFLGLSSGLCHRLDRLTALLLDPALAGRAKADHTPAPGVPRSALWAMGISGDRPLVSMTVPDPGHIAAARFTVKAMSFWRAMGLEVDLALIDMGPGGYDQPVTAMLRHAIDASPLRDQSNVFILNGLTSEQVETVRRASSIALSSDEDIAMQVKRLLDALEPMPEGEPLVISADLTKSSKRFMDNGFGGFTPDGYEIDVQPTPAPWCNILATDGMGLLLTERGGGFVWHSNSRFCRLTAYRGDPQRERFPIRLDFIAEDGRRLRLLPVCLPCRVKYTPNGIRYTLSCGEVAFSISDYCVLMDVKLNMNRHGRLDMNVDWLMGAEHQDAAWLRTWASDGAVFATGTAEGVSFLCADAVEAEAGECLTIPVVTGKTHIRFALGWAEDVPSARRRVRSIREGAMPKPRREDNPLTVDTPDPVLNIMMNRFLPHQVRASRVLGRTGYSQPGGAYGFRDQLQDMLALIPLEPERVRAHLLLCAGRQFAAGDALHWWHMPHLGVRTRISDDRLFLPWVAAEYALATGDAGVLQAVIPYLEDVPIPEGQEDIFRTMKPGETAGTLHDHCMRAFRATDVTGEHGLALMGAGDWNDGMNRVGHYGRGESVWLSQFLAACADRYAEVCPSEADAAWLRALARRHRGAVELYGWDGAWYLRAYMDDGTKLGGADADACQIDLIAQAWSVLAGLSPERCRTAMEAAWRMLSDEEHGIIRLLTPPFDTEGLDPGYIRGYPGGVRENGAQYTHAACWLLLALVRMGDSERAHRALHMLLPASHSDAREKALRYRVEPYVMAGDVCALPGQEGRGGWTWYTGSAAWLYVAVLELLGCERRGDRVRLNALLGDWPGVSMTLKYGNSQYRLVCKKDADAVTLDGRPVGEPFVPLIDDGQSHVAQFPPRT